MRRVNEAHSHEDRGLDAYWTPPEAVRALARIERLPGTVWDPACGGGSILDVLAAVSFEVHGSDICDYGWPGTEVRDYLGAGVPKARAVVTNPPYRWAARFLGKALEESEYVAFLLRLNFLESMGRLDLFRSSPPSRVWVSSRRLPMMHRQGWDGPKSSSNHAYAWFVWDRREAPSDTKLMWFDWKEVSE